MFGKKLLTFITAANFVQHFMRIPIIKEQPLKNGIVLFKELLVLVSYILLHIINIAAKHCAIFNQKLQCWQNNIEGLFKHSTIMRAVMYQERSAY